MKWIVTKTFKYTEDVEVEADSRKAAEEIAADMDGTINGDDWLYSCEAKKITEES